MFCIWLTVWFHKNCSNKFEISYKKDDCYLLGIEFENYSVLIDKRNKMDSNKQLKRLGVFIQIYSTQC